MINSNSLFRWLAIAGLVISIFAIAMLLNSSDRVYDVSCLIVLLSLFINLVSSINQNHKIVILTMAINLSYSFIFTLKVSTVSPDTTNNLNAISFLFNGITLFLVAVKYFFERTVELIKLSQEKPILNKPE